MNSHAELNVPIFRLSLPQIIIIFLGFLIAATALFSLTFVLAPLSHSLHLSLSQASLVVTMSWVGGGLGGLGFGWLADRWGRRRGLLMALGLVAVSAILGSQASNGAILAIAWFLVGSGVNGENGASYALIAEGIAKRRRGVTGSTMAGLYFAGALVGVVMTGIVLVHFPSAWRDVLMLAGILVAIIWVFMWWVPESEVWQAKRKSGPRVRPEPASAMFRPPLLRVTIGGTALAIGGLLYLVPFLSLISSYLESVQRWSVTRTTTLLIVGFALGFCGYVLDGLVADRWGRVKGAWSFIAAAFVAGVAFWMGAPTILTVPAIFFTSGFFAHFGVWMSESYPPALKARGNNLTFMAGRVVGGGLGPVLATSLPWQLKTNLSVVLVGAAIISSGAVYVLKDVGKIRQTSRAAEL